MNQNQLIQLYFNNTYLNGDRLFDNVNKVEVAQLFNKPIIGIDGPNGLKAVQFNKDLKQYISVDPIFTGLNGITFTFWLKCDSSNQTWSRILDFGNGVKQDNIIVFINNGCLGLSVYQNSIEYIKTCVIPEVINNTWNHYSWTLHPQNEWELYVNGASKVKYNDGYYPKSMLRVNQYLGKSNWSTDPYFNGFLADFRIYNSILKISDINSIYNQKYSNNYGDVLKDKPLNTGFTQLYNEIFCDLFKQNNGFIQCTNCNFGEEAEYSKSTQTSEQNCLNACGSEPRCTSYSYDNNKSTDNCTQYITFPEQRYKNNSNINSGYNITKFTYDFNKLPDDKKKNVALRCSSQFLNNYFIPNKNIELKSCIKNNDSQNITNINIDPECIYNVYKKNGLNTKIVNQNSYSNDSIMKSESDPIIDDYQDKYFSYIVKNVQNSNINNKLSAMNPNTSIDTPIILDESNQSNITTNIKDLSGNIISTIGTIESFENNNNNININYCNILILLFIISLIIILIYLIFK
jgi:hypothetical protein